MKQIKLTEYAICNKVFLNIILDELSSEGDFIMAILEEINKPTDNEICFRTKFEKLDVQEGDIIVITTPEDYQFTNEIKKFATMFSIQYKCNCITLSEGVTMGKVEKKVLEDLLAADKGISDGVEV